MGWAPVSYIIFCNVNKFWINQFNEDFHPDFSLEGAWELYTEPKKKVKMWQWILRRTDGQTYITQNFYESKEESEDNLIDSTWPVWKRADWTEIEVEVDE